VFYFYLSIFYLFIIRQSGITVVVIGREILHISNKSLLALKIEKAGDSIIVHKQEILYKKVFLWNIQYMLKARFLIEVLTLKRINLRFLLSFLKLTVLCLLLFMSQDILKV